jgi:cytochrome P450
MSSAQRESFPALHNGRRSQLAELRSLLRDPLGYQLRAAREQGGICEMPVPFFNILLVSDAALCEQVLVKHPDKVRKDRFTRILRDGLGNGLAVSEGSYWRKQRRSIQPVFQPKRVGSYAPEMVSRALDMRTRMLEAPGEHDITAEMVELSLRTVASALFGGDITLEQAQFIATSIFKLAGRAAGILGSGVNIPLSIPTPGNVRDRRVIERLEKFILGFLQRERNRTAAPSHLLSHLLAIRDDEGKPLSDRELRDETLTLFIGGYETSALNLTFALHALAHHRHVQDAVQREVDAVTGGAPPTFEQLSALTWTRAVVSEALRLYPPAFNIGREVKEPFELAGRPLQRGTQLWLSSYNVQRDPRYFSDPDRFLPERWLSGELQKQLPGCAFLAFGAGPRVCIGNTFALTAASLALATFAQRLDFAPAPGQGRELELAPAAVLRPARPVLLDVQPR